MILDEVDGHTQLTVRDNGVGMSRGVVTRHLIGVGSDFWHSAEFYRDFGKALDAGFRPIGRFGIGFLSVFMLGDRVEVNTEAAGSPRITLHLRGLGRRGELSESTPTGNIGTEVCITLKGLISDLLRDLVSVVRARAPMLRVPITVRTRRGGSLLNERIEPGWWKHIEDSGMIDFVDAWQEVAFNGRAATEEELEQKHGPDFSYFYERQRLRLPEASELSSWPGVRPQFLDESTRLTSLGADVNSGLIICSQGIAASRVHFGDLVGIMEAGELELTAARAPLSASYGRLHAMRYPALYSSTLAERVMTVMRPAVVTRLNDLERWGMIPARLGLFRFLALTYGEPVLHETALRWIPVIEPPGNLIHRSKPEVVELLRSQKRVLFTFGASPGSAYQSSVPHVPVHALQSMLLIASRLKEVDIEYSVRQEFERQGMSNPIRGTLEHVMELGHQKSPLVLVNVLIGILSEAWDLKAESIRNSEWCLDYKGDVLWADVQRELIR